MSTTTGWNSCRLKYVATCNDDVLPESTEDDFEFYYVDISSVTQGTITIPSQPVMFGAAPSRARRRARPADTVISTVRTYLKAIAPVPDAGVEMVFSTGFAVLRARTIEARFLSWLLQSDDFTARVEAGSVGVSYPAVNASDIMAMKVMIPEQNLQLKIADYLDRETAQIDTLIAKQEQLIATLRERRVAAVERAVLEGLDKRAHRSASLESAPNAPSHWSRARISHLAALSAGGTPDTDNLSFWADPGDADATCWVAISDMSKRDAVTTTSKRLTVEGMQSKRLTPSSPGTILFAMYASVGEVSVLEVPAVWNQAILGISPDPDQMRPRYMFHLLRALKPFLLRDVRSNTQANLNAGQVGAAWVPVPPVGEQQQIVAYLDAVTAKIDALIAKAERFIELSKERRAALITAAVTGQIEVPAG